MSEITTRLMEVAAKRFNVNETLRPEDDFFEKLGIDSVQALSLLSELEMTFDVEIPDYELQDVKTFQALGEVIERRK